MTKESKSWQGDGWAQATLAWQTCASIHATYAKGKDPLFTARQKDFIDNTERARQKYLASQQKDIAMADKEQHRRFFTDEDYRNGIRKSATQLIESSIAVADQQEKFIKNGVMSEEDYHPPIDMADTVAYAILSDLNDRSGVDLDFDPEINHEIADTVAEIVRQGMKPNNNIYERVTVLENPAYPQLNNRVLKATDGYVQPPQVREFLFDALIDKAIHHGQEPGDFTPVERCIRTVRSVINILDGAEGNRPDGEGLPLIQMELSPHPDYLRGLNRIHDIIDFGDNLLDYGVLGPNDYQGGMTRLFDHHFDQRFEQQIQSRQARAARDLFKE
jgi:hypothetical protein